MKKPTKAVAQEIYRRVHGRACTPEEKRAIVERLYDAFDALQKVLENKWNDER